MRTTRNYFLIFILTTCISFTGLAQVDPLYAQYTMSPLLINPAYAGLTNTVNASASYRMQWSGMDGSPSTFNGNIHSSVHKNKMGAGLIMLKDQIGNRSHTEVQATYAYRLPLRDKFLSFGLQGGFITYKHNNGTLNPYDPNDPVFGDIPNVTKPSLGAGLILSSDRYFIGLSVPRLLNAKNTVDNITTSLYNQHFYVLAAYVSHLNEHVKFKPSVLLKGVKGSPLSIDCNLSAIINDTYTAGLFSRNLNTYGVLAQLKFGKGYRFGYAFEMPANNSIGTQFTSHEVCIGLNIAAFHFQNTTINNF
jgi:type IX secretion system PorP/SprF family membrane protein